MPCSRGVCKSNGIIKWMLEIRMVREKSQSLPITASGFCVCSHIICTFHDITHNGMVQCYLIPAVTYVITFWTPPTKVVWILNEINVKNTVARQSTRFQRYWSELLYHPPLASQYLLKKMSVHCLHTIFSRPQDQSNQK